MENQPKLNSSKEVIAFLAERFPLCFIAEGEARPLKIGIFQDIVGRLTDEDGISKTQLRTALRMYTSSWRYLYGVKEGAKRVGLDGDDCGELESEHVEHARQQLAEAKARVQTQRAQKRAAEKEKMASERPARAAPAKTSAPQRRNADSEKRENRPQSQAVKQRKPATQPKPQPAQPKLTPVTDITALTVGQNLKVKVGASLMDASVLEIAKDGVRVQLLTGLAMIVRAEHLKF